MKNYLIIGAARGIGQKLAELLMADGHNVYGTYHETPIENSEITAQKLDVLSENFDFDFLPETLDGIAYCPGTINLKPFGRIKPSEYLDDFNLQVVGFIKALNTALPRLKKSSAASVVVFSTVAVQTGFPFHAQVAASKGALEGVVRALAAELAPSIRINAIAPSITKTPLAAKLLNSEDKIKANADRHPLKKIGEPGDIAAAALFLLSENASWITGQILPVDGGISAIKM